MSGIQLLRLPRNSLIIAAATLLVALVSWVAVRAAGPAGDGRKEDPAKPVLVVPSAATSVVPAAAAEILPAESVLPSASAVISVSSSPTPSSASPSTSRTPSASPSASRTSTSPTPRTSSSPTPRATTTPAPAAALKATYSTGSSWQDGFIASVRVTNTGTAAAPWSVTVNYPSNARVRVQYAWNASANGTTFSGGPLQPGASITFGFQASKRGNGLVAPVTCSIAGIACS